MAKFDGVSFIIPSLNEEDNLPRLLYSIKKTMNDLNYEIIIVDNGSKDRTQDIAQEQATKLLVDQDATIGGLRNIGVSSASYNILAFLDADMSLDESWPTQLQEAIKTWPDNGLIITGNSYLIPENASLVEKHWFSKLVNTNDNYINSGHLITTIKMFNKINGFNEDLRTAEDYDFCQRAKSQSGTVRKCKKLIAIHHGFPKTVFQFILREAWHGREDFKSISNLANSKTALISLTYVGLLITTFLTVLTSSNNYFALLPLGLMAIVTLVVTYIKFGESTSIKEFLTTSIFTQLYFLGRALSPFVNATRPRARDSHKAHST